MTCIIWFRRDLRLSDHAALLSALEQGPVVPAFVLDDETPGERRTGGAQRWWLHHSLQALSDSLESRGAKLILRRGDSINVLEALMAETGASQIHATRTYEPWWQRLESELGDRLALHDGNYLAPPVTIRTGSDTRYKVFTPYWRNLLDRMPPPKPRPAPESIDAAEARSDRLDDWALLPRDPDWAGGFDVWTPGEDGAKTALREFLGQVGDYGRARNMPSEAGTSRLSPHLHFGEVSPANVWHHVAKKVGAKGEPFLRELGWRDYAANLLDQFPDYNAVNGRPAYDSLTWRSGRDADSDFAAWTKGRTGYPIVDAGMRQLWTTGWMHNRVRMIAASFMIKHLLIDWRRGERWFWDTLVDADAASNTTNWQWVAGTGVDAPMFSRIMAPLLQSDKFDAGDYIRQWVPELSHIHGDAIHDPHAGGEGPAGYPHPLIGHREARERALAAMRDVRGH